MTTRPVRDAARLVGATLRRRKRLFAVQAGLVLAGSLLLLAAWPRAYHVEARVLARPDPVLLALSNPELRFPRGPRAAAAEAVRKRATQQTSARRGWPTAGQWPRALLRAKTSRCERWLARRPRKIGTTPRGHAG
jgi:hypothetical protein